VSADRPGILEQQGFHLVGYSDLAARPAFKLAVQQVEDRWYLYTGHFWHQGWSVVDVTDPTAPSVVNFVAGPQDTWTLQIQVADGLMITSLEGPSEGWGIPLGLPHDEGVLIWDVATDPVKPTLLGRFRTGGRGTHRNFYAGGNLAVLAANPDGFAGNIPVLVDLSDPRNPREISRWWWPGQHVAAGEEPEPGVSLHGPAHVRGNRAYLGYGRVGMVVLDISDRTRPELVARVSFGDLGSRLGCHTALPLGDRGLVVANSEAIKEGTGDALNYAFVIEEHGDEFRIASWLPVPEPREGLPYATYYEKGGRFGPHNQHHPQGNPAHGDDPDTVLLTYFNAGLRRFDVSNPLRPRETGFFVPEDPAERRGTKPTELVTQFEDVLVDSRGYIYCTDKNHGLFVLRED
jgi:hypothetical protein